MLIVFFISGLLSCAYAMFHDWHRTIVLIMGWVVMVIITVLICSKWANRYKLWATWNQRRFRIICLSIYAIVLVVSFAMMLSFSLFKNEVYVDVYQLANSTFNIDIYQLLTAVLNGFIPGLLPTSMGWLISNK